MYYFLAAINVYFVCEWLKHSSLVHLDTHHFTSCIAFFKDTLEHDILYRTCDILNYQENFTKFVVNIIYMLLVLYALTREVVRSYTVLDWVYWTIVPGSAVTYSLMDDVPLFQFSLTSNATFDTGKTLVCVCVGIVLLALLARQYCTGRLRYRLLLIPTGIYLLVFVLFLTTSSISYHLHHVIAAGYSSLCFTEFDVPMNRYLHALFIGIVIQGINFYTIQEVSLFNIPYAPPPSFQYMTVLTSVYSLLLVLVYKRKELVRCFPKKHPSSEMDTPLLIPSEEDMKANIL